MWVSDEVGLEAIKSKLETYDLMLLGIITLKFRICYSIFDISSLSDAGKRINIE